MVVFLAGGGVGSQRGGSPAQRGTVEYVAGEHGAFGITMRYWTRKEIDFRGEWT